MRNEVGKIPNSEGKRMREPTDAYDYSGWSTRGGAVDGKDKFHYPIHIYDPDNQIHTYKNDIIWKWKTFYEKHQMSIEGK